MSDKPQKKQPKKTPEATAQEKSPQETNRSLRAEAIVFRSKAVDADGTVSRPLRTKKIKFRSADIAEADDVKKRLDRDYPQA